MKARWLLLIATVSFGPFAINRQHTQLELSTSNDKSSSHNNNQTKEEREYERKTRISNAPNDSRAFHMHDDVRRRMNLKQKQTFIRCSHLPVLLYLNLFFFFASTRSPFRSMYIQFRGIIVFATWMLCKHCQDSN